ncbi:hypothetical protein CJ177_36235 [Rhodococcus sp. ACPA1]|nr:hypothetical protein CJ177_36235 [Rhodococcus sp. ACPA1]
MLRSRDSNRRNPGSRLRERGDIGGYQLGGRYMYPLFSFERRLPAAADGRSPTPLHGAHQFRSERDRSRLLSSSRT